LYVLIRLITRATFKRIKKTFNGIIQDI
jgi:hypothetical protein